MVASNVTMQNTDLSFALTMLAATVNVLLWLGQIYIVVHFVMKFW